MAGKIRLKVDKHKFDQIARIAGESVPTWVISDSVEYGIYVELGTERMTARPALVPAFENNTRGLGDALGQAIERGVSLGDVVAKVAFDIQFQYQDGVPVVSGALKNGIKARPE